MKNLIKILALLTFSISCMSTKINLSRKRAYKLNKEYIKTNYNLNIDDENVGFYITKDKFEFFSLINDEVYHVVLDKDGDVIGSNIYEVFPNIRNEKEKGK